MKGKGSAADYRRPEHIYTGESLLPFKTTQTQSIKCQFSLGSEPFWAWVYSVFVRQVSIKELIN